MFTSLCTFPFFMVCVRTVSVPWLSLTRFVRSGDNDTIAIAVISSSARLQCRNQDVLLVSLRLRPLQLNLTLCVRLIAIIRT